MPEYTLSKRADRDLNEIYRYSTEKFGKQKAASYLLSLIECLEMLAHYPYCGSLANHVSANIRRHWHCSHVIYYHLRKHDIFILRILHQSMHVKRHLK